MSDALRASLLIRLAQVASWVAMVLAKVSLRISGFAQFLANVAGTLSDASIAISERALWYAEKVRR